MRLVVVIVVLPQSGRGGRDLRPGTMEPHYGHENQAPG